MLEQINTFILSYDYGIFIGFGILSSAALYFIWGKKSEFSLKAIDNTLATIAITIMNLFVATIFFEDINNFMQSIYQSLHIPHLSPEIWTTIPFALVCIIGLLISDFAGYLFHRFMHTKWAWPAHAAHHSDTHVNAFTTFRVHVCESVLVMTGSIFLLTWLQIPEAIPVVYIFKMLLNMYVHINADIHHGPFKYLLASPRYHRWHHADIPEAYGKNLANIFPFYDKLFGTYYVPGPCTVPMGALETGVKDTDVLDLVFYPFKEWGRLIKETFRSKTYANAQEVKTPEPKMENV